MQRPQFTNGEIYHIYNRGVEKRNIFDENGDYLRFIHHLYHFNNSNPVTQNLRRDIFSKKDANKFFASNTINTTNKDMYEVQPRTYPTQISKRKRFVDIYIFTLMPNHFHLLVKQNIDDGIIKFMQKIGTGYTMFFNNKYDRVGSLFQGRYKAVLIENDAQLLYIPHYIHLNPLGLLNVRGSTSYIEDQKYLENYKWSSFPDYIGKKNFPSVTQRNFILNLFNGEAGYKKDATEFIKEKALSKKSEMGKLFID